MMKINNFFVFIMLIAATNGINAAELTIYNAMNRGVTGQIRWYNSWQKKEMFQKFTLPAATQNSEPKIKISTGGAYPFTKLMWMEGINIYQTEVPSTAIMLMGTIVLRPNGLYSINFDKNGASSNKVREWQVAPERMPGR